MPLCSLSFSGTHPEVFVPFKDLFVDVQNRVVVTEIECQSTIEHHCDLCPHREDDTNCKIRSAVSFGSTSPAELAETQHKGVCARQGCMWCPLCRTPLVLSTLTPPQADSRPVDASPSMASKFCLVCRTCSYVFSEGGSSSTKGGFDAPDLVRQAACKVQRDGALARVIADALRVGTSSRASPAPATYRQGPSVVTVATPGVPGSTRQRSRPSFRVPAKQSPSLSAANLTTASFSVSTTSLPSTPSPRATRAATTATVNHLLECSVPFTRILGDGSAACHSRWIVSAPLAHGLAAPLCMSPRSSTMFGHAFGHSHDDGLLLHSGTPGGVSPAAVLTEQGTEDVMRSYLVPIARTLSAGAHKRVRAASPHDAVSPACVELPRIRILGVAAAPVLDKNVPIPALSEAFPPFLTAVPTGVPVFVLFSVANVTTRRFSVTLRCDEDRWSRLTGAMFAIPGGDTSGSPADHYPQQLSMTLDPAPLGSGHAGHGFVDCKAPVAPHIALGVLRVQNYADPGGQLPVHRGCRPFSTPSSELSGETLGYRLDSPPTGAASPSSEGGVFPSSRLVLSVVADDVTGKEPYRFLTAISFHFPSSTP